MPEDFIFTLQLDDTSLCDDLINYYERSSEYKQRGASNGGDKTSTDVVVYPNSTDPAALQYYGLLKFALSEYKKKLNLLMQKRYKRNFKKRLLILMIL